MNYEPIMKWESAPATIPQVMSLTNAGIEKELINSRGMASKLFDLIISRRERGLATIKQLKLLAKLYVKADPLTLTFDEASKTIDETLTAKRGAHYPPRQRFVPSSKFHSSVRMARSGDQPTLPL